MAVNVDAVIPGEVKCSKVTLACCPVCLELDPTYAPLEDILPPNPQAVPIIFC